MRNAFLVLAACASAMATPVIDLEPRYTPGADQKTCLCPIPTGLSGGTGSTGSGSGSGSGNGGGPTVTVTVSSPCGSHTGVGGGNVGGGNGQSPNGLLQCGGAFYYPSRYTCYGGDKLCPILLDGTATLECGDACYSPKLYT